MFPANLVQATFQQVRKTLKDKTKIKIWHDEGSEFGEIFFFLQQTDNKMLPSWFTKKEMCKNIALASFMLSVENKLKEANCILLLIFSLRNFKITNK